MARAEREWAKAAELCDALLGDKEDSFRYLDLAYTTHDNWLTALKVDRDLAALRRDARYSALLQRVGLPP